MEPEAQRVEPRHPWPTTGRAGSGSLVSTFRASNKLGQTLPAWLYTAHSPALAPAPSMCPAEVCVWGGVVCTCMYMCVCKGWVMPAV